MTNPADPMKILVTWYSETGNTRKVADAIFEALSGDKTMTPFSEVESLGGYDLSFIGFPVKRFGVPGPVREFITTHAAGKRIALFVTHAMPSDSEDPQQQALLEKELAKCRAACSKSELVAFFHCRGELSEQLADELRSSNIPVLMEFAGMRSVTLRHPDQSELEAARAFARLTAPP